jgi:hypothetical protein
MECRLHLDGDEREGKSLLLQVFHMDNTIQLLYDRVHVLLNSRDGYFLVNIV